MKQQIPRKIQPGGSVYVISPSAGLMPFVQERVKRATKNLSSLGLNVIIAAHADKNNGYLSASIEDRVDDLHKAFRDKNCSMIMASIGGNHSNQLLEYLDYELIRQNPKIFIGYSDITVLHYALFTKSSLRTYYGPCFLNQFGENPAILKYTLDYFQQALFQNNNKIIIHPCEEYTDEVLDWFQNKDAARPRSMTKNQGFIWWKKGTADGWAFPATISSLNHLLGTPYLPDAKGSILMLDIPEGNSIFEGLSIPDVDSYLTDLKNNQLFAKINGLIIARPYNYTAEMIIELKKVILRICHEYQFPILFNVDFGHTDPMITIPIGANIQLEPDKIIISV